MHTGCVTTHCWQCGRAIAVGAACGGRGAVTLQRESPEGHRDPGGFSHSLHYIGTT